MAAKVRLAGKVYQSAVVSMVLLNKVPPNSEAYNHKCFLLVVTSAGCLEFIWTWVPGLGWFRCASASQPSGLSGMCLSRAVTEVH